VQTVLPLSWEDVSVEAERANAYADVINGLGSGEVPATPQTGVQS